MEHELASKVLPITFRMPPTVLFSLPPNPLTSFSSPFRLSSPHHSKHNYHRPSNCAVQASAFRRRSQLHRANKSCSDVQLPVDVQTHFFALCADIASQLESHPSSPSSLPTTWPSVLHNLAAASIIGVHLKRLCNALGHQALLSLSPSSLKHILRLLIDDINLTRAQRIRVILRCPAILEVRPDKTELLLHILCKEIALNIRDLRKIVLRMPNLLCLDPFQVERLVRYLERPPTSFSRDQVRALLRRAPWLLTLDLDTRIAPAVNWLDQYLPTSPLSSVIAANPLILTSKRRALFNVRNFLLNVVSLSHLEYLDVCRSFPILLTCEVGYLSPSNVSPSHSASVTADMNAISSTTTITSSSSVQLSSSGSATVADKTNLKVAEGNGMIYVLHVLQYEINLSRKDVSKMVRAFPALMTLDIDQNIRRVVNYLKQVGIRNIARIIKALPPILGYDIESNIHPKMSYLLDSLKLSITNILMFPAVFSYSLQRHIIPRTHFLLLLRIRVSSVGLNLTIALKDEDFCRRVAKVPLSSYKIFIKQHNESTSKINTKRINPRSSRAREQLKSRPKRRRKVVADINHDGENADVNEESEKVDVNVDEDKNDEKLCDDESPSRQEDRVWGKRRFRTKLSKIPWSRLS